jgi:two-component system, cell cycle sensor histidine kinase and response regulator CckA
MAQPRPANAAPRVAEVSLKVSTISTPHSNAIADAECLRARLEELEGKHRLLEEQVRQLQHVKAVSDLLTGVAHDLSGALTGIVWCTEAVKARVMEHEPDLAAGLQDMIGAADYARRLARKLMSIGRQREGRFERCRAHNEIAEAVKLLDVLRPKKVRLIASLGAASDDIWGCGDQLQQLVVNLGTNAFDALGPEGGDMHLELTRSAGKPSEVVLRVRDAGQGMDQETLRRATEPFFTTKGPDDGNGLGLVVVKGIVERHGGRLTIESAPGCGTTVEVAFPTFQS